MNPFLLRDSCILCLWWMFGQIQYALKLTELDFCFGFFWLSWVQKYKEPVMKYVAAHISVAR